MDRSDPIVSRALDSFHESWRIFAACSDGARALVDDDVAALATGGPYAIANQVVAIRDARGLVERAREFFGDLPFILHVPDDHAGARAEAEAGGLVSQGGPPFMVLQSIGELARAPEGVRLARVTTKEDLEQHLRTMAVGFGMPGDVPGWLLGPPALSVRAVGMFNAYVGDEPVATAVGITSHDAVAIYSVATLKHARGRGIGEAVTAAAIAYGASLGADIALLQASDMGRPVYERMGFRARGSHAWFATPPQE